MLNELVLKTMPLMPRSLIYLFAKKYIAGADLSDAVKVSKKLADKGASTTIDTLGEFVISEIQAQKETNLSLGVLNAIDKHNLDSYLSIKPTSLGLDINFDFAYENIKRAVIRAKEKGLFVRLDMENAPYTTKTLDIYKKIRDEGYDNIGFVIQAYLKRSMNDLKELAPYKPSTRLCKGIYIEHPDIAYKEKEKIRENFKEMLQFMVESGYYPAIATHDKPLLDFAEELIKEKNLSTDEYEFQMLLGVTESLRSKLIENGHKVRIYIPYGEDWYGYSIRRLNENPKMVGHVIKSIFTFS
jgi:proline dehydrogenase